MGNPHALVIPYPAQGHVLPMMELSHCLVNCGFKITFINTEFNHKRILDSLSSGEKEFPLRLITIPDGLEPEDDRKDLVKLTISFRSIMPGKLEEIIQNINGDKEDDELTCLIADGTMAWALKVATKMGIRQRVMFWPASAGFLALAVSIPKLINDRIIDTDGIPTNNQTIQLSPTMPTMNTKEFMWNALGDSETNKIAFRSIEEYGEGVKFADWLICNSSYDLEPGAISLVPNLHPIGPLLASNRLGNPSGNFWPEDSACLTWLDQQPARSVIYVAFGSFTVFEKIQFHELAFGLELSGQRFLWVTRPDSSNPFPERFQTRVSTRGLTVRWAPQQNVLSHPSVACFLSHCGWNSTMEGVSNGVSFLCWPYFGDQLLNEDYICDIWEIGLRLHKGENGIISRKEISEKLIQLLEDQRIRERSLKLMEMVNKSLEDGECSSKNFENFVKGIKI